MIQLYHVILFRSLCSDILSSHIINVVKVLLDSLICSFLVTASDPIHAYDNLNDLTTANYTVEINGTMTELSYTQGVSCNPSVGLGKSLDCAIIVLGCRHCISIEYKL